MFDQELKPADDIRPISELRNYNKLLEDVQPGHPITLTKNGYGKYVVLDLNDYYALRKTQVVSELTAMVAHARQGDFKSLEQVKKDLQIP